MTETGSDEMERLYEFVENTRETAKGVEKVTSWRTDPNLDSDRENGVSIGLRWAADELEAVLDELNADAETNQEADGR